MALGPNRSASMSSGLLLDPIHSPNTEQSNVGPRFRPYASPNHHVTKGRYITSNDPRGYIPVYEYPLNGQWIMLDMDDGYVLWTGIWKALGNNKADIVKIIDSQPDLASQLRRVRGGYLKIQGTWMPYEIALRLARRVAWPIRHDLVPLFGPTFPGSCLSPDQPGYGQIVSPGTGKRRARRSVQADISADPRQGWTVISPVPGPSNPADSVYGQSLVTSRTFHQHPGYSTPAPSDRLSIAQVDSPVMLHVPYVERAYHPQEAMSPNPIRQTASRRTSPPSDSGSVMRYSPYPASPLVSRTATVHQGVRSVHTGSITLPSIQPRRPDPARADVVTLPPISAMDAQFEGNYEDSIAVLRRLQSDDEDIPPRRSHEYSAQDRRYYVSDSARRLSDASFSGVQPPSLSASSRASSASTLSPPLSSSTHDSVAASGSSGKFSHASIQQHSNSDRRIMPPPPSPRSDFPARHSSDHQRSSEKSYYGAVINDQNIQPEKRTWRPW